MGVQSPRQPRSSAEVGAWLCSLLGALEDTAAATQALVFTVPPRSRAPGAAVRSRQSPRSQHGPLSRGCRTGTHGWLQTRGTVAGQSRTPAQQPPPLTPSPCPTLSALTVKALLHSLSVPISCPLYSCSVCAYH